MSDARSAEPVFNGPQRQPAFLEGLNSPDALNRFRSIKPIARFRYIGDAQKPLFGPIPDGGIAFAGLFGEFSDLQQFIAVSRFGRFTGRGFEIDIQGSVDRLRDDFEIIVPGTAKLGFSSDPI